MNPTRLLTLVVLPLVAAGAVIELSAQSRNFNAERNRLHQAAVAARAARKLDIDDPRLAAEFPPAAFEAFRVQKVRPGSSVAVALKGLIPAGVTVLSERDAAVLTAASITRSAYSARLTIGAGEGPGFVRLYAYTPVSHNFAVVAVAFIDSLYAFDLKTADGLTVKLTPVDSTFTLTNGDRDATVMYKAEFFRPNQSTPFETRSASMLYLSNQDPRRRIDISIGEPMAEKTAAQEMEEIGKQLEDLKITQAQREALMQRLGQAQMRSIQEMLKGATPQAAAEADKARENFGCRLAQIDPGPGSAASATVLCGKNFYNGVLRTTGAMTRVN